jgi:hypothetical protein
VVVQNQARVQMKQPMSNALSSVLKEALDENIGA